MAGQKIRRATLPVHRTERASVVEACTNWVLAKKIIAIGIYKESTVTSLFVGGN